MAGIAEHGWTPCTESIAGLDGEAVWGDQTLVGAELEDEGHRLYVNDKLYFADRATFLSS